MTSPREAAARGGRFDLPSRRSRRSDRGSGRRAFQRGAVGRGAASRRERGGVRGGAKMGWGAAEARGRRARLCARDWRGRALVRASGGTFVRGRGQVACPPRQSGGISPSERSSAPRDARGPRRPGAMGPDASSVEDETLGQSLIPIINKLQDIFAQVRHRCGELGESERG